MDEDQQPFLRWRHHSSGLILRSKTEAKGHLPVSMMMVTIPCFFSCDFPMSFSASSWCEMMWKSHCFSIFLFSMFLPIVHQCHTDLFPCSNLSFSPPNIYIYIYIYLNISLSLTLHIWHPTYLDMLFWRPHVATSLKNDGSQGESSF